MSSVPRRGRPPSASLLQRTLEGMASDSRLKCTICSRVFPRPKSLRAHYYCHTGQTPYACDYPGCNKAFKQSGHLRSHTFRHTGEKPFRCRTEDCGERFLHSNRHCPVHDPSKVVKVIRDGNEFIDVKESSLSEDQRQWLNRYRNKKYSLHGTKRPAENNDSDEENFSANYKRTSKEDGYSSVASESPSSSPIHTNEYNCTKSSSESSSEFLLIFNSPKNAEYGARFLLSMQKRDFSSLF